MAKLLYIKASPRPESYSTRVAMAFLEAYKESHPDDKIETLDLFKDEFPPFLAPQAKAKYAVMGGQPPKGDAEKAWAEVIKVINRFTSFDKYVLSTPMWNFSIPYRLKQYIDVITQPGLTFKYNSQGAVFGMVTGKPMTLVMARGGVYGAGNPTETMEFQESYLRGVFGFIGITDIRSIYVQGTLTNKPDQIEADTLKAVAEAKIAAVVFVPRV